MRISCLELKNFRRLFSVRIDISEQTTLFVGANNSGKTSAMTALRYFFDHKTSFKLNDIPLNHFADINKIGEALENQKEVPNKLVDYLPCLDVWLEIGSDEIHRVSHLIPTLDWKPEDGIGVRLQLEPKKDAEGKEEYIKEFLATRKAAIETLDAASNSKSKNSKQEEGERRNGFTLWPSCLTDFLDRRIKHLQIRAYLLDPSKKGDTTNGFTEPQILPDDAESLEDDPFGVLIKINEIPAQRGFGDTSSQRGGDEVAQEGGISRGRLSSQLNSYYEKHLDPKDMPDPSDVNALEAIFEAQTVFNEQLKASFYAPIKELEGLGYPGVANPSIALTSDLNPSKVLRHSSEVQYDVVPPYNGENFARRLPEHYNGLGYQNLISMVFKLISFRDSWMKVGKAGKTSRVSDKSQPALPPIHLVLIEEPEAHLHAQVQQVFIKEAYKVMRNHPALGETSALTTQIVISTHSSHIAHEVKFADMRYFRRNSPIVSGSIPTSTVVNLSDVFGGSNDTARFVSRYLKATHADLFFADAAILVEGAAERMLVPHFIRNGKDYGGLRSSYVSLLEVGGSHAHRLMPIIEKLGLNSLIITDIDTAEDTTGYPKAIPKIGVGLVTRNNFLRTYHPKIDNFDSLLSLDEGMKEKKFDLFSIRVAFQVPIDVVLQDGGVKEKAISSTFEDALAYENMTLFENADCDGLIKKIKNTINSNSDMTDLSKALFEAMKSVDKAGFALDILYSIDPTEIKVPTYIHKGLEWLQSKLVLQRTVAKPSSENSANSTNGGGE